MLFSHGSNSKRSRESSEQEGKGEEREDGSPRWKKQTIRSERQEGGKEEESEDDTGT